MASMNAFETDVFGMVSLSGTVDRIDYKPGMLGELGVFEPMPVRSRTVYVDEREGSLSLIPTSPIGAAPDELKKDDRTAVPLKTTRIAKGFTMYAEEVQDVRAFGGESEAEQLQAEYLRHMARVRDDVETTHEHMRLGALQGILLDADGTTVIYDYTAEFNRAIPTATNFNLNVATTNIRAICHDLKRSMARSSKGAMGPGATVHALAGDNFFDQLIDHENVRQTYLNWQAAQDLREDKSFGAFTYGGITFHNYRGTDDNSTVAVAADEVKFFPVGGNGVFKQAMAPAEFGPYVNTLGQNTYAMNIPDRDRQAWTRGEIYSYPLFICQRPDVLRAGVAS